MHKFLTQNNHEKVVASAQQLPIAEMDDRLATIDMGRKEGDVPLSEEELGPHQTQCGLGRGLPPYQVAS